MVFIKRLWMKVDWLMREGKAPHNQPTPDTFSSILLWTLFPPQAFKFQLLPHWVWGEIDKENNTADNQKWIEFEHNWDELQCLKIESFQKWAKGRAFFSYVLLKCLSPERREGIRRAGRWEGEGCALTWLNVYLIPLSFFIFWTLLQTTWAALEREIVKIKWCCL